MPALQILVPNTSPARLEFHHTWFILCRRRVPRHTCVVSSRYHGPPVFIVPRAPDALWRAALPTKHPDTFDHHNTLHLGTAPHHSWTAIRTPTLESCTPPHLPYPILIVRRIPLQHLTLRYRHWVLPSWYPPCLTFLLRGPPAALWHRAYPDCCPPLSYGPYLWTVPSFSPFRRPSACLLVTPTPTGLWRLDRRLDPNTPRNAAVLAAEPVGGHRVIPLTPVTRATTRASNHVRMLEQPTSSQTHLSRCAPNISSARYYIPMDRAAPP